MEGVAVGGSMQAARPGGGTGRRGGLKIPWGIPMRVRIPPRVLDVIRVAWGLGRRLDDHSGLTSSEVHR